MKLDEDRNLLTKLISVLGPMVYVAAVAPVGMKNEIKALGVDDSKVLKEEFRDSLLNVLESVDFIGWKGYACSPKEISESMLRKHKYNLNALAHDITIQVRRKALIPQLIRDVLKEGLLVDEIYIDTVGPPQQYQDKLEKLFPRIKIKVAKKADSLYPIVSAASIVAKTKRDQILKYWKFDESVEFSREFGSGYPSDPKTTKWLKNNFHPLFGFPNLIRLFLKFKVNRFSWSTAEKIIKEEGIQVKWAEPEEEVNQENKDIRKFFMENNSIYSQLGLETIRKLP
jgi:ribonuclease H2 subunit A